MTLTKRILIGSIGAVFAASARPVVAHDWVEFNGHSYALTDVTGNWQAAEDEAVALGGHLVAVGCRAENDFLLTTFAQPDSRWIGLYQIPGSPEPGGGWVWSNGEPVGYTNWCPAEPNNYNGVEHWAELKYSGSYCAGQWNDVWALREWRGIIELSPPTTTVITHGFLLGSGKPDWAVAMAEQIALVADGSVYGYDPATGGWLFRTGSGLNEHVVLVLNWAEESDGELFGPGPNWMFAEAAADAFYSALRDLGGALDGVDVLRGRTVHLIGHSRGASVNSELARRLLANGAVDSIDQVTTLDAHPVNGALCDWGDRVPSHWIGVDWTDNYFQGSYSACQLPGLVRGLSLLGVHETNLSSVDWNNACTDHTNVHAWYHGTITGAGLVDGCEIHPEWFVGTNPADPLCESWDCQGYVYSALRSGSCSRPSISDPMERPTVPPVIFNGSFDIEGRGTYAGWWYHGGTDGDGSIVTLGDRHVMRMTVFPSETVTHRHNRFFLPCGAAAVEVVVRLTSPGHAGDYFAVDLTRDNEPDCRVGYIDLEDHWASYGTEWRSYAFSLDAPCVQHDRSWQIELEAHAESGNEELVVEVDNVGIQMYGGDPCDTNCDGTVDAFDIEPLLAILFEGAAPCASCAGDANGDGTVNAFDIEPFLNCLFR